MPAFVARLWSPRWSAVLLPAIALAIALAILAATVQTAKQRGMDRSIAIGPGEQNAIAIALSESVYNAKHGYLGLIQVLNKMQEYWNRDSKAWNNLDALKRNYRDPALLNEGIRAAASLGPQQAGYVSDGSLFTTYYDDIGQVDYVKVAFALFGMKIQSLFYLYFTLIGASCLIAILTFRRNALAIGLILSALFAYFIELHLAIFDPIAVPTFPGMRHGSTLGLLPMWHFTLLLLLRTRATPAVVAGTAIQLAILVLAWRIRGAVAWMLIFVFLTALWLAWLESRAPQPRQAPASANSSGFDWTSLDSWLLLGKRSSRWPVLVLLAGLLASGAYNRAAMHPVYFTDDILPYHGLWHSAYLGLAYSPKIFRPMAAGYVDQGGPRSDSVGFIGSMEYLDKLHLTPWRYPQGLPESFRSPWTGMVKARFHDEIMRLAFFDAILRHPVMAVQIYAYKKPKHIFQVLSAAFIGAPNRLWIGLVAAAGLGVFGICAAFATSRDLATTRDLLLAGAGAAGASALPYMWAYPGHWIIADSVLSLVAAVSFALGAGAFLLTASLSRKGPAASSALPE